MWRVRARSCSVEFDSRPDRLQGERPNAIQGSGRSYEGAGATHRSGDARIVYRDWRLTNRPFGRRDPNAGRRDMPFRLPLWFGPSSGPREGTGSPALFTGEVAPTRGPATNNSWSVSGRQERVLAPFESPGRPRSEAQIRPLHLESSGPWRELLDSTGLFLSCSGGLPAFLPLAPRTVQIWRGSCAAARVTKSPIFSPRSQLV